MLCNRGEREASDTILTHHPGSGIVWSSPRRRFAGGLHQSRRGQPQASCLSYAQVAEATRATRCADSPEEPRTIAHVHSPPHPEVHASYPRVLSMSGGFFDIYVLGRDRSEEASLDFLNAFAPRREQSRDEYLTTDGGSCESVEAVVRFCAIHLKEKQSIYCRNLSKGPAHVMVFFNVDGSVIWGLSVSKDARRWLTKLRQHSGSQLGCVTFEEPPPETADDFRTWCVARTRMWKNDRDLYT